MPNEEYRQKNGRFLRDLMAGGLLPFRRGFLRRLPVVLALAGLLAFLLFRYGDLAAPVLDRDPFVGGLALFVGVFVLVMATRRLRIRIRRRRVFAKYRAGLQSPTPDALVALSDGDAARLPAQLAPAYRAAGRAQIQSLYGDALGAGAALAAVPWDSLPPMLQAMGLRSEALVMLLHGGDGRGALARLSRARELSAVHRAWYLGRRPQGSELGEGLAEVLAGDASRETLATLKREVETARHPLERLLAAYAIAVACRRAGDPERAAPFERILEDEAPHCVAFHRDPADAPLEPALAPEAPAVTAGAANAWAGPRPNQVKRYLIFVVAGWLLLVTLMLLAQWLLPRG
jgi:hypothetical protein